MRSRAIVYGIPKLKNSQTPATHLTPRKEDFMFTKLKLRARITLGFAAVVTPFLIALLMYHDGLNSSVGAFHNLLQHEAAIATLSGEIKAAMLQCRRDEKDFLLSRDKKLVDKFSQNIEQLKNKTRELGDLGQKSGNREVAAKASAISGYAQDYEKSFKQLALFWKNRGLDQDSGLQGKFRDLVHNLESSLGKISDSKNQVLLLQIRRHEKDYLLRSDAKYVKANHETIDKLLESLRQAGIPQETMLEMENNLSGYKTGFDNLVAQDKSIASETETMRGAVHKIEPLIDEVYEWALQTAAKHAETTEKQAHYRAGIAIGIAAAALVVSILLVFCITRCIVKPVARVTTGLGECAEQIVAAASQVSSGSQQLAEGSSEQAASIEEISSSLEEMSSMTKQNADNSDQTNQLMNGTRATITRASQSMESLINSMGEISRASEETSKIIKTIDEIAFQTNLLALNAAVEAARAGEAGAGFAVVADEVRNLAVRAAEAAKNTASLIEGTVKKVKEGSELVERTDLEFREVTAGVGKSNELVGEISAASSEQAQGIEQINKAVTEMDKVVQQNAGNAEESASAAEEMSAQAVQMKEFVADLTALVGTSSNMKVLRPQRELSDHAGHSNDANNIKHRGNVLSKIGFQKLISSKASDTTEF